jgi:hypothetical protein
MINVNLQSAMAARERLVTLQTQWNAMQRAKIAELLSQKQRNVHNMDENSARKCVGH